MKVTDEAVEKALLVWYTPERFSDTRSNMRRVLEQFAASAPSAVEDAVEAERDVIEDVLTKRNRQDTLDRAGFPRARKP